MNSLQRVLTTLGFKEPDQVPLFLLTTIGGARELGISIKEYFSRPENVVEGQMRLLRKFRSDSICPFFYASREVEAFGGDTIFIEDGPPNAGRPIIKTREDIFRLVPPKVSESKCLIQPLDAIRELKNRVGDAVPIIGVAISPFSLPVMQMGFDHYIELMLEDPEGFNRLMQVNEAFSVEWANAQLAAGATTICYFDPVSSVTNIPRELYLKTGQQIAKRVISRINGSTATHFASGRALPIIADVAETGTTALGVSVLEDLAVLKKAAYGKLTLVGNLNGVEMRRWTPEMAEREVKKAIAKAGRGGGFILSDNHGEIPWQVPDEVLFAIREATDRWGKYPLDWIDNWNKNEGTAGC